MTLDPIRISWIHNCLWSWADSYWLCKVGFSRFSHPSNFRRKTLNVVLLDLKFWSRNKHWEISVFSSIRFEFGIKECSEFFPDRKSPWSQNIASRNVIIIKQTRFNDHIRIPFGKILIFLCFNTQQIDLLFFLFLCLLFLLLWGL